MIDGLIEVSKVSKLIYKELKSKTKSAALEATENVDWN